VLGVSKERPGADHVGTRAIVDQTGRVGRTDTGGHHPEAVASKVIVEEVNRGHFVARRTSGR